MYILAPSLLAADFTKLGEQIKETERCGAQFLHIDVMDGIFVPSISFGMPLIESIRPITKQFFDVHLMIVEPERYIQEFVDCGADGRISLQSAAHRLHTESAPLHWRLDAAPS